MQTAAFAGQYGCRVAAKKQRNRQIRSLLATLPRPIGCEARRKLRRLGDSDIVPYLIYTDTNLREFTNCKLNPDGEAFWEEVSKL